MAQSSTIQPVSTFILRFFRETAGGQVRWRSRIEHVQSGANASCLDLQAIVRFIQGQGVMMVKMMQNDETEI